MISISAIRFQQSFRGFVDFLYIAFGVLGVDIETTFRSGEFQFRGQYEEIGHCI